MPNNKTATIYCKNSNSYHDFPLGTSLAEILSKINLQLPNKIVAARVNCKVEDLNFLVYKPKDIEFLDTTSIEGMRVYINTLSMIFGKAVSELYPNTLVKIEFPISHGYYCHLINFKKTVSLAEVQAIKQRMKEIIAQDKTIISEEKQRETVQELFAKLPNQDDKLKLFDSLGNKYLRYFRIDDYLDYYNGVLMPSTSYVQLFDLQAYDNGILLLGTNADNPSKLEDLAPEPKILEVSKEFYKMNEHLNINSVGELNKQFLTNKSFSLIKIAEALHEKKLVSIVDAIAKKRKKIKFILVSGPSSSGKTTFSKRLAIQLVLAGFKPEIISLDNYFLNRQDTPRDANGDWDFESIYALDLPLYKQQLQQLLAGETVEMPSFSFEDGKRYFKGEKLHLQKNSIIIMEGIHALNPELLPDIPEHVLYKIYVSALSTISLDNHNWISTFDTCLLRRIIRDFRFRNYSAQETIKRWASVRRGGEKWIYPFSQYADVVFNSSLAFELAVLKKHAEPILDEVPEYCEEYTEACRLKNFLNYFVSIPEREIPPTSLLREFIGGSSFKY
ncbi:MAG: nucleoside kinase [Paludibacter sp.]|jgi:uridine kinase|nr:nucleoside kinase [Paludibacter sp.]